MKRRDYARLKARKEQKPCDAGLFSDDSKQAAELTIPDDLSIPEFLKR